ncbi:MAG: P1 family peptidase [Litorilinea sp.]
MTTRPRARELPIPSTYWQAASGPNNAITDVPGVRVAHVTLHEGEGALQRGQGPVRTGVTMILPHAGNLFQSKVTAATHVINGFGKACGLAQIHELGQIETPIALTNTLSVWRAADALAQWSIDHNPTIGVSTSTVNPVVAECNDGYLNDVQGNHLQAEHVIQAIHAAQFQPDFSPVVEGNVGGGTGMACYGWKGGIGSAGRPVTLGAQTYTVGALVQANFGRPGQLLFAGHHLPSRRDIFPDPPMLPPITPTAVPPGSVVVILATDAPLDARQLHRLSVRATAGLARTGSTIDHGSGDFVIAFSVSRRIPHAPTDANLQAPALIAEAAIMDALLPATVEAVEESVLNALCAAETLVGRDGHMLHGLPLDMVADQLTQRQIGG